MATCSNAELDGANGPVGDPTELALLRTARQLGADVDPGVRERQRERQFHFDPVVKLMTTVDRGGDDRWVHTKGAPESVLPRCALDPRDQARVEAVVDGYARQGLRLLALARRRLAPGDTDANRDAVEAHMTWWSSARPCTTAPPERGR
jgi:magnesium-transporting ATPase (P-type)